MKMRWMGTTGPTHVKPLTEDRAAELGAEIIGDSFVYSVAAGIIVFEYVRSKRKEQDAEDTQNNQIARLHDSIRRLEREMKDVRNHLDKMNNKQQSIKKDDKKS